MTKATRYGDPAARLASMSARMLLPRPEISTAMACGEVAP
jgi:hypothetical protein